MPSKTEKQHNFFEKILHDPWFAKKEDVDPEVAKEFVEADKASGKFKHPHPDKDKK
jgi:hypothetical protein